VPAHPLSYLACGVATVRNTAEHGSSAMALVPFGIEGLFASMVPSVGSIFSLCSLNDPAIWGKVRNDPAVVLAFLQFKSIGYLDNPSREFQQVYPSVVAFFSRWIQKSLGNQVISPFVGIKDCLTIAKSCHQFAELSGSVDPEIAWIAGLLGDMDLLFGTQGKSQELAWDYNLPVWLRIVNGLWRPQGFQIALDAGVDPSLLYVLSLARDKKDFIPAAVLKQIKNLQMLQSVSFEAINKKSLSFASEICSAHLKIQESHAPFLLEMLTQRSCISHLHNSIDSLRGEINFYIQGMQNHIAAEEEKLLDRKLRSLAELAAGAGHEINNPLAVIQGNAQFLMAKLDDIEMDDAGVDYRSPLQSIIRQARRINELIRGLMHFARPLPPSRVQATARDVLLPLVDKLSGWALDHKVRIEFVQDKDANVPLFADLEQSRIAVEALARNAIEAAGIGGWVRVITLKNSENIEIIVEDSGPGVHPDIVEHLFDPFYSGRPAGRGKGLGLSLAWKFAKANQGRVEFRQKQVDQPTRFTLFLPSSDLLNISETPVHVAA